MGTGKLFIGIDTSCYTTSVACVSASGIISDERTPLTVAHRERGLRQSEALFQHVKSIDKLIAALFNRIEPRLVGAIGYSCAPSSREDSYMPVFLEGASAAKILSCALKKPLYSFTHQQGHIRAALYGNEHLRSKQFAAFHLSGGTSELLHVYPDLSIRILGGTTDISAGQLVDRIGVYMGLSFPSGALLEQLAASASEPTIKLPSCVDGVNCSFSGVESQARRLLDGGCDRASIAFAVYDCISRTLSKQIHNANTLFGLSDFLLAGGVASSAILRRLLIRRLKATLSVSFSEPSLSTDNAVGIALLCMDGFESK